MKAGVPPSTVLIVGATSEIAIAVARVFAANEAWFFLAGLFPERLAEIADDLRSRGAERVETFEIDLTEFDRHPEMLSAMLALYDRIDYALVAHGIHIDQHECEASVEKTLQVWNVN